jgi:hypothetical protein
MYALAFFGVVLVLGSKDINHYLPSMSQIYDESNLLVKLMNEYEVHAK